MRGSRIISTLCPVPSDLAIAQAVAPASVSAIAAAARINESELRPYGKYIGKVSLSVLDRLKEERQGNYVLVTAMSPTPLGEGKSTTTIGLAQAMGAHMGKQCIACIRQPSQGPTFGVKGGAAGGGYAQVVPMEEFNLHGTGDIHAIGAANNLLAAAIDTRIYHELTQSDEALYNRLTADLKNFAPGMQSRLRKLGLEGKTPADLTPEERVRFARLDIDPETISWSRVVDCNDRMLREITIGQGKEEKNKTRTTHFEITVASEIMAIVSLSENLQDMRRRIGAIVVARSKAGDAVTADDLGCAGAMTVLMKDAIEPSLYQTLERTPALVHAGPFANIAQGNSSVVADRVALKLVGPDGYVLTEAGFGGDMGAEKFYNIKCRASGLRPQCAVIVATIRALKFHGGIAPADATKPNAEALHEGCSNLIRHVTNMRKFGTPVVVAINRFATDIDEELALVKEQCSHVGAFDVVVADHWSQGGAGAVGLGEVVARACAAPQEPALLYDDEMPLKDKIERVCTEIYGAGSVEFGEGVLEKLADFHAQGYGKLPVCMAKTQYSFSTDPAVRGAPSGFTVPVRDVRVSAGAGFVVVYLGKISTMPGLPTRPGYFNIDIDDNGRVVGLS